MNQGIRHLIAAAFIKPIKIELKFIKKFVQNMKED
jgi:hypothetical protein